MPRCSFSMSCCVLFYYVLLIWLHLEHNVSIKSSFWASVAVCGPYGFCVCPVGGAHVTLALLSWAFDQIIAPQTWSFQPLSVTMETDISASCVEWLLVVSAWPLEWRGNMSPARNYEVMGECVKKNYQLDEKIMFFFSSYFSFDTCIFTQIKWISRWTLKSKSKKGSI